MMINCDYKYTSIHLSVNSIELTDECAYFYGYSTEGRSHIVDELKEKYKDKIQFVELKLLEEEKDVVLDKNAEKKYSLRSSESICDLLNLYKSDQLYIDISGLNNRVTASLLNNAFKLDKDNCLKIHVLYAEPKVYDVAKFRSEGLIYDLSEKIEGIEPLPGFASLYPGDYDQKFIALLGFEGGRFTYLLDNIDTSTSKILPVVGVPGYRIEYPFVALWGNRQPLEDTKSWENILYIGANSLVDAYMLLKKELTKSSKSKIIVAPIGTKPHAIAAILFAIKYPNRVEIMYDNPKRKVERTKGVGLIIECCVSELLNS